MGAVGGCPAMPGGSLVMTRKGYFKRVAIYSVIMTATMAVRTLGPDTRNWFDIGAIVISSLTYLYGLFDLISAGNKRRDRARSKMPILDQNVCPFPGVNMLFISACAAAITLLVVPFFAVPLIVFQSQGSLIGLLICSIVWVPMLQRDHESNPNEVPS